MLALIIKISFAIHNKFLNSSENWLCVIKSLFFWLLLLCLPFSIWLITLVDLKKIDYLKSYRPSLPSKILDRNGREISVLIKENRHLLVYEDIPLQVIQAFIAIEDNTFFEHIGIEPSAILRAIFVNFLNAARLQGGSTITQQLVKIILTSRERTYLRKLKEIFFVFYMEYSFSKKEIITMYLNQIYLGHGNYGIQSASRFFFNKDIHEISLVESAILASLTAAPNTYSFLKNPTRSFYRVNRVLLRMADLGFISLENFSEKISFLVNLYSNQERSSSATAYGNRKDLAPHVTEYVRQEVLKYIPQNLLYSEGLKIHTTIDLNHQQYAQKEFWSALKRHDQIRSKVKFVNPLIFAERYSDFAELLGMLYPISEYKVKESYLRRKFHSYVVKEILDEFSLIAKLFPLKENKKKSPLERFQNSFVANYITKKKVQGAFVELDNLTGGITVLLGGSPFSVQNQLNRAVNINRQLGSTFKPFLYSVGLNEDIFHASTLLTDTPLVFLNSNGKAWIPSNYSGGHRGNVLLRDALTYSINSVSVEIAQLIKIDKLIPTVSRAFSIDKKNIPHDLTIALGTMSVSPLHVAQAYSIFPRGGDYIEPYIIEKIETNEKEILYEYQKTKPIRVFKKSTAVIMRTFLEDVIERGTASFIRRSGFTGIGGGKTGTTQNFRDAWFAGFNKRYTSVVWIGYDNYSNTLGLGKSGGRVAAPIWYKYQQLLAPLIRKETTVLAEDTENIIVHTICTDNGFIVNFQCIKVCLNSRKEFFAKTNIPRIEECVDGDTNILSQNITTKDVENKIDDAIFFNGDEL